MSQIVNKSVSKLLDRVEVELLIPGKAGLISRKDAVALAAEQMKVDAANVGLVSLQQRAGTRDVTGRFYIYGSAQALKKLLPAHLSVRMMSKEEREALKQAKKKEKTAAPQPEKK